MAKVVFTETETGNPIDRILSIRVDKRSAIPVYLQISEAIRSLIRSGVPRAGTALPPERVLCEKYGVSRMTLRAAYEVLERDGFIECRRGSGTFVCFGRVRKFEQEARSFTEEITSRGAVPSSRLLTFQLMSPSPTTRDYFGLAEGDLVYQIQRVRLRDGVPLALETVELPQRLCPDLDRFNVGGQSLYEILEAHYGIQVAYGIEEISAARPNRLHKQHLNIKDSAAVLVIRRQAYSDTDTPVELAVGVYRADMYRAVVRSTRVHKD